MDDAALARRLQEGDASAWADVYDRYADRLHDYCASILHDPHEAEDALHDAFVTASQRIDQLRDPDRLRPWLYAICRTTALGRARRRSRIVPSEEVGAVTPAPAGPDPVEERDLQRLVWDAAEGLAPQDKAVLYLHLRHGLTGEALGEALEVSAHHANVRLSRVRGLVERSLTVLLVGRVGRRDCPELDALLAGWDGRLDPRLRKRVARHIDDCEVCEERRRTLVSPLGLLAAMPLVPAPPDLREPRADQRRRAADGQVDPAGGAAGGGWRRRLPVAGAVAAAVVAVLLALALRPGGSQPDEVAATESTTTEASTTTTSTLAPTSTTARNIHDDHRRAAGAAGPARGPVPVRTTLAPPPPRRRSRSPTTAASPWPGPPASSCPARSAVPAAGTLAPGATARVVVVVDRRGPARGLVRGLTGARRPPPRQRSVRRLRPGRDHGSGSARTGHQRQCGGAHVHRRARPRLLPPERGSGPPSPTSPLCCPSSSAGRWWRRIGPVDHADGAATAASGWPPSARRPPTSTSRGGSKPPTPWAPPPAAPGTSSTSNRSADRFLKQARRTCHRGRRRSRTGATPGCHRRSRR